jgi:hypothetical protein
MDASSSPMDAVNQDSAQLGSKDGLGASDHDEPYVIGRRPTARAPYPFTEIQYARLLMLRGRVRDTSAADDLAEAA